MFHSFELTKSIKRIRKTTYDNDDFFVCWNEPDDEENESIYFYRKPVHPSMEASFAILIGNEEMVQNVKVLENHCIVYTQTVYSGMKFLKIYRLEAGAQNIATFSINDRRHDAFAIEDLCLVNVNRVFYLQKIEADISIRPFDYTMIKVKHFSDNPFLEKLSFHSLPYHFKTNSWYESNFMIGDNVYDYEMTMYKHLLFIQRKSSYNDMFTYTNVYKIGFSVPIIEQVLSHKGKVFHSENKIIFHSELIIFINDFHTLENLYKIDIEHHFNNYNVFINDAFLSNDEEIKMTQISEESQMSYHRDLVRENPLNVTKIYASSSFDIFMFLKKETSQGTLYTTFNFKDKSISSIMIRGLVMGSEVNQVGIQNMIISDKKISVIMNQNVHDIVKQRSKCGMFRAEQLLYLFPK